MATKQPPETSEQQIDVTAAEWLMIIVTGFTGIFAGPFAIIPGAVVVGMFTYRLNPELMKSSAAGKWVRGFLPAPAPEQETTPAGAAKTAAPVAEQSAKAKSAMTAKGKAAKALPVVELERLAKASTVLLVGSRGSGKSTLLLALLATKAAIKESTIAVYDPHAAPGEWPMATMVHNSEHSISSGLVSAYKRLQARKDERRKGIRTSGWPKLTLAADEWGSIVASVKLPEAIDRTPGEVSTELMKEGRKFGIGFVAGAHGFTNKSLGCTGDQEAFLNSFDWIVHMGVFTRKQLPPIYIERWNEMPMGENEQGGTFPLCVACEHKASGEIYLLDMRGLDQIVDTHPAPVAPIIPVQRTHISPDAALLANLMAPEARDTRDIPMSPRDTEGTAAESEGTAGDMGTGDIPTALEIAQITMSLSRGLTVNQTAKAMKGYNGRTRARLMAKVEYVKTLIDAQPASDASEPGAGDEDEPPEWFGKNFGG